MSDDKPKDELQTDPLLQITAKPVQAVPEGDYITWDDPVTTPLDAALDKVCGELGLKARPGGASQYGWSMRSMLMACPYKYRKLYLEAEPGAGGPSTVPLETGGLFHQLLAFYYMWMLDDHGGLANEVDYEWVKARLLDEKVSAEVIMNAHRLFDAYRYHYETDYIKPLAIEIEGAYKKNTCRFDSIVEVVPNEIVIPGTYIMEHKTASRFDFATLEQWKNDGQILGQVMIWNGTKLWKQYGDLAGVIVNLVSKTQVVNFRRILITPPRGQLVRHVRDLKHWDAMELLFRASDYWPRNRASCRGPYGLCPLHDHCAGDDLGNEVEDHEDDD